jgi:hypothetical protein
MQKIRFIFLAVIFISVFISPKPNLAFDNWTDDLGIENWIFYTYERNASSNFWASFLKNSIPNNYKVENNILISPYIEGDPSKNCNSTFAFHDSNVTYGTWSFDVFIDNWTITNQNFEIGFIFNSENDNYNYSWKSFSEIFSMTSGLSLVFEGDSSTNPRTSVISLYQNIDRLSLFSLDPSYYNDFHNILINRTKNGNLSIYLDQKLIIVAKNTLDFQSKKFEFDIFQSIMKITNISVSTDNNTEITSYSSNSQTDTSLTLLPWYVITPAFIFLIKIRKQK